MAFNNDVFAYKRSYNTSHIVLINFGSASHTIDVNLINNKDTPFPTSMKVAVAGSKSSYNAGQSVTTNAFVLKPFDAVVLTDSASSVFASLILVIGAVLIKFFL